LSGPLIIEQSDATVVVPPAAVVEPLAGGVLRITTQPESKATSEMAVRSEYHA
jgi:hypothetical protein